ncbi:glycosyltransferase [Bacteroidota bacterium]
MAFKRPIVATRVGGIPEVVADGQSGHLVERGDVEAMADRISSLLVNAGKRSRMGEADRQRVAEMFDIHKDVAKVIDWYGIPKGE